MAINSDYADSDDMEQSLQMSLDQDSQLFPVPSSAPRYQQKQRHKVRLAEINSEISKVEGRITEMQNLLTFLHQERNLLTNGVENVDSNNKGKRKDVSSSSIINYMTETFEWSGELELKLKNVFSFSNFRSCQLGVCNANLDDRDIICIMPTSGGKSLTYQLPALLSLGCTLVISPLVSLMTDQIYNLNKIGVEAVMLSSSTSSAEFKRINALLENPPSDLSKEIKLCYVTPERIASSDSFNYLLKKMSSAGRLSRFVVDEAHCISSMGHDFRKDYMGLSKLRILFPHIPILALTATCPPRVLEDLLKTLMLKDTTEGARAEIGKTVLFQTPLYRKNLHYSIVPKPATVKAAIKEIAKYILENHRDHSGIVYCFTKSDAEQVAEGLITASEGKIKTGTYHADVHDQLKIELHRKWRQGEIKVVCATVAFGLGIDKADVRFVIHHSMSKALEGYYQESGRAGRDGNDADCVLFYKAQDVSRLLGKCYTSKDGIDKVYDMLRFARDMEQCRKVLFAKHFSAFANLALSSWTTEDSHALAQCSHCDNCTRSPETIITKDITVETWQILKVLQEAQRSEVRVTVGLLASMCKGGNGADEEKKKNGKGNVKVRVDVGAILASKIEFSIEELQNVIVHLLTIGYMMPDFHPTPYKTLVYIKPNTLASRLTVFSLNEVKNGKGTRIMYSYTRKGQKKTSKAKKPRSAKPRTTKATKTARTAGSSNRKLAEADSSENESTESDEHHGSDVGMSDNEHRNRPQTHRKESSEVSKTKYREPPTAKGTEGTPTGSSSKRKLEEADDSGNEDTKDHRHGKYAEMSDDEDYDWETSLRNLSGPQKRARANPSTTLLHNVIDISD